MNANFDELMKLPDSLEKYLHGGMQCPREMPGRDYWRAEYAKNPEQALRLFELDLAFNKFAFRNSNQHTNRHKWRVAYQNNRNGPCASTKKAKGSRENDWANSARPGL